MTPFPERGSVILLNRPARSLETLSRGPTRMTELPSGRPGPAGLEEHPERRGRQGREVMGHAPVALDLARLLDEHATADLAATSKSLEEVNKLAHIVDWCSRFAGSNPWCT